MNREIEFHFNSFRATGLFYTPLKHQKTSGIAEVIARDQWHEMGWSHFKGI